jgi:anti-anti-sigma regulatory factor
MSGTLKARVEKDVFVVSLSGYLNQVLSETLLNEFQSALQQSAKVFCFDFSHVDIVNSVALGRLLDMISEGIADESLEFIFVGISKECRFGFEAIGILAYVKEFPNIEEWQRHLQSRGR